MVSIFQALIIPVILVSVLNAFTTDSTPSTWTHRILLTPWDWAVSKSTPLFTLIEGFASLLVIQAIGQVCRWVVNNRSDTWMVLHLTSQDLMVDCVSCVECFYYGRGCVLFISNLEFSVN